MATTADLNIVQGGTYSARIAVTDTTGGAINLSGYTTRGFAKHRYGDTGKLIDLDPDVVSGSGTLTWLTALKSGLIDIDLTAAQTAALPVVQGVEMYNATGTVTRILQGKINISPEVTS
jgi:hypothetical protein